MLEREELARTFDQASSRYHRARPRYPDALFDRLLEVTGLEPPAHLAEVGCATGIATEPLAERGFRITCIEPGPNLLAEARRNLAGFDQVSVIEGRFEDVAPAEPVDLVYAATAWHWTDPTTRYHRAAALLRPRGWLAFWHAIHVIPDDGDTFFAEIQPTYDEIGEGLPPGWRTPAPGEVEELGDEIVASGHFEVVDITQLDWEVTYDADGYLDLLSTFSGHIAMADWKRDRLFAEVRRRLAARPDGSLRRHWGVALHIAQRLA